MYEQALIKLMPIYHKIDAGEPLTAHEAKIAKALLAILVSILREHTPARKPASVKGK